MRHGRLMVLTVCGVCMAGQAFAAAVMQRRIEQQKQMQAQAYQQAVAQKQAQEMAAYSQAMAQRQAVMQQQAAHQKAAMEYAVYKKAMQEAVARRNAEMQAAAQIKQVIATRQAERAAYEQALAKRQVAAVVTYKQALAQKQVLGQKVQQDVNQQVQEYAQYLTARKAALAQQSAVVTQAALGQKLMRDAAINRAKAAQYAQTAQTKVAHEAVAKSALGQMLAREVMSKSAGEKTGAVPLREIPGEASVDGQETMVGLKDLWDSFDRGSLAWEQIVEREIKLLTVAEYIDRFKKLKIRITKEPGHYVALIDALALDMPGFLETPFMNVLSYAAIVEYDFESGTNKDDLARQLLGPERFESNRKRLFGR